MDFNTFAEKTIKEAEQRGDTNLVALLNTIPSTVLAAFYTAGYEDANSSWMDMVKKEMNKAIAGRDELRGEIYE